MKVIPTKKVKFVVFLHSRQTLSRRSRQGGSEGCGEREVGEEKLMQGFGEEHGPRPSPGIILKWVLNK